MKNSLTLAEKIKLSLDLIGLSEKLINHKSGRIVEPKASLELLEKINYFVGQKDLSGLLRLTWPGQDKESRNLIFMAAKALEEELKAVA